MHVTEAFHHYARPLIQAELTPIYIDACPAICICIDLRGFLFLL